MWPFTKKNKPTPTKGKYWSQTSKHVYNSDIANCSALKYCIRADIYCGHGHGAEYIDRVWQYFSDLDEHETAIDQLSKKCYDRIQQEYKKEIIIAKLYEVDKINNKLEMFARSNLGSIYAQSR